MFSLKWTINKKLLGSFSAVLLLLIITIVVSYIQITEVDDSYSDLISDKAMKAIEIKELQVAAKQEVVAMRGYVISGDKEALQDFSNAVADYKNKYESLKPKFKLPEAIKLLEEVNQIEHENIKFSEQVIELKKQNKRDEYETLLSTQGKDIVKRFDEEVAKLSNFQNNLLVERNANNTEMVKKTISFVLILGIIAVVVGITIALFMGRLISKPIISLASSAKKIAEGDLSVDVVSVKNKDEIGELVGSFNLMTMNLRTLIEQVSINSIHVASAAEELTASAEQTTQATDQIALSIQDIASGSDTQVQSANECSTAMQEMTIGIQQVAETSSSVSESAIETNKEANLGNESLQKVIHQMNTINTSVEDSASVIRRLGNLSNEIGNIIGVITGIADQTNLLALNAAIEAARAGEHGKGFAVVADEVRKLAEQSKESADQIAELINKIQVDTNQAVNVMEVGTQEVATGMQIVRETGEGFEKILRSIEQVTAQIQEVSAISEEMSASAEEVNASLEEMAHIAEHASSNTQNVASASEEQLASMEEITSSASSLSNMAEDLQALVSKFKI
ncbi:methyl-accepting chemotaxis protein [Psychrobacillus sp. NPDC058041]|uniref:methyl-accepting chemotaxis protein n=1 Tax=Psychrobacillus sp. NPDC058041 TaxID=3346310 RepID=UPI0036DDF08D